MKNFITTTLIATLSCSLHSGNRLNRMLFEFDQPMPPKQVCEIEKALREIGPNLIPTSMNPNNAYVAEYIRIVRNKLTWYEKASTTEDAKKHNREANFLAAHFLDGGVLKKIACQEIASIAGGILDTNMKKMIKHAIQQPFLPSDVFSYWKELKPTNTLINIGAFVICNIVYASLHTIDKSYIASAPPLCVSKTLAEKVANDMMPYFPIRLIKTLRTTSKDESKIIKEAEDIYYRIRDTESVYSNDHGSQTPGTGAFFPVHKYLEGFIQSLLEENIFRKDLVFYDSI
ncbi:hypothetical protein HOD08_04770 [bacterium]|jgi:hypothetical protein|nr:hypothetical protein [bacterium]